MSPRHGGLNARPGCPPGGQTGPRRGGGAGGVSPGPYLARSLCLAARGRGRRGCRRRSSLPPPPLPPLRRRRRPTPPAAPPAPPAAAAAAAAARAAGAAAAAAAGPGHSCLSLASWHRSGSAATATIKQAMASLGHTRAHSHSRARSPARPSSGQAPPARRGRLRRTWERRPDGRPAGSPRGAVRALCREPGGEGLRTAVHVWTAGRLETRTMGSGAEPEAIGQQPRTESGAITEYPSLSGLCGSPCKGTSPEPSGVHSRQPHFLGPQ
uniref:Serine/arginine repetitive matrix protein 1-like n=1 Tax=Phascolarctos cinereus TaxID=38626 RepID=A0A6P5IX66_PHACI|nr:serine/arginine repetitive matrix protein 1-like [Phascolarctos cinereus]